MQFLEEYVLIIIPKMVVSEEKKETSSNATVMEYQNESQGLVQWVLYQEVGR